MDHFVPADEIRIPQSEIRNPTWLPAALLATLTLLIGALQAFGDDELQWRRAATPSRSASSSSSSPVRHIVTREHDARGFAVVQVAYNDAPGDWSSAGGSFAASGPVGSASLKSVVVHPAESTSGGSAFGGYDREPTEADFDSFGHDTSPSEYEVEQIAQNPFTDDLPLLDENDLSRDLTEPFGVPPVPDTLPEELRELEDLPEPSPRDEEDSQEPLLEEPDADFQQPFEPPITPRRVQPTPRRPGTFDPFGSPARELRTQAPTEEEREQVRERCDEEREAILGSRIASIDLSIRIAGEEGRDYPYECTLDDGTVYLGRSWPQVTYMWKAAANCHKPLYFEQQHLERYGHSWGPYLQPVISGAHFFTRIPVLPYCMGITPPNECVYPLGYYRAGNCAPYMVDAVPFTWRAAAFQAGATVGTAAILP